MEQSILLVIDIVAITVLTLGLNFPRHRRKDMVVAYPVVNIGITGAAVALSSFTFAAGLGLRLFVRHRNAIINLDATCTGGTLAGTVTASVPCSVSTDPITRNATRGRCPTCSLAVPV